MISVNYTDAKYECFAALEVTEGERFSAHVGDKPIIIIIDKVWPGGDVDCTVAPLNEPLVDGFKTHLRTLWALKSRKLAQGWLASQPLRITFPIEVNLNAIR